VGKGNIEVGNEIPARKLASLMVEGLAGINGASEPRSARANPPAKTRSAMCGAMAQQSYDSGRGNQSAPQKLLQLVGWREPKARPQAWVRPRPAPVKR